MNRWIVSVVLLFTVVRAGALGPYGWPERIAPLTPWYLLGASENDTFVASFADDCDDLRTFGFRLEAGFAGGWLAGLQQDVLTDRGAATPGSRIDEVTFLLSPPPLIKEQTEVSRGEIRWGPGLRFYGNWGGEWLQDSLHTGTGIYRPYSYLYENDSASEFLLHTSGSLFFLGHPDYMEADGAAPLPGRPEWGVLYWSALSTLSRVQAYPTMEFAFASPGMRTGLRIGFYDVFGLFVFDTVRTVDGFERGLWLSWYVDISGLRSGFRIHLDNKLTSGWFGLSLPVDPSDGAAPDFERGLNRMTNSRRVTGEFGITLGHYLFIQQFRWLVKRGPVRIAASLDYRTGVGPKTYEPEYQVRVDQFSLGPDFSIHLFEHAPFAISPFVTLQGGIRHEGLVSRPAERRAMISTATFPVLQAGVGLRLWLDAWGVSLSADSYIGRRLQNEAWYYSDPWAFGILPSLRVIAAVP